MEEEKYCPLCGKSVIGEHLFCEDCQQIARDENPADFYTKKDIVEDGVTEEEASPIEEDTVAEAEIVLEPEEEPIEVVSDKNDLEENQESDNEPEEESGEETEDENDDTEESEPQPRAAKSNKKGIIFILIGALALVIIGWIGSQKNAEVKTSKAADTAYWNACVDQGNLLAYSKYLVRYPDGVHREEAQAILVAEENKERLAWKALQNTDDVTQFAAFFVNYPSSSYEQFARQKLDSVTWILALKENTVEAYSSYLEQMKSGNFGGRYQTEAQEKYDYISQLKNIEGADLTLVSATLVSFFQHLSAKKYDSAQKLTTPVLINFYGVENKAVKELMDAHRDVQKKAKVKSLNYALQSVATDVIQDNKGVYTLELPIRETTAYTDRKKKVETTNYVLKIELNSEKLIQSVSKK